MANEHGGICKSCGGMVDAEGFAMGGEVGDEEGVGALTLEDISFDEGPQSITDKRQKNTGAEFANAVWRARRP